MPATIGPDLAGAAVAVARRHPHAPPLDVLDVVLGPFEARFGLR